MFGATEQRLNEYAIQMVEFKKKQTIDKSEMKKIGFNGRFSNYNIGIKYSTNASFYCWGLVCLSR